ncbi:DUF460 domain-containing protein [Methanobacterium petrolearium]|uniref:DUF460 domain-containing protein n=1 Tax=Methanobacterium petrolearium TaxID=710190 RepID=UPI001FD752A9|nr:hypothetical protein GCM10025861_15690 [Methanobacterium petrolearium]
MTVGVAILDLSGEILNVNSFKEASRAKITKHIISYGRTILVATDVHQTPKMVKKMAASLNSRIYFPDRDMAVNAKNELVDEYIYQQDQNPSLHRSRDNNNDLIPQNAHERDALAAAIQCYKKYQKKLEQIERRTKNLGLTPEIVDDIKISVINEIPITKAINRTLDRLNPSNDIESPATFEDSSHGNVSGGRLLNTQKSSEEDMSSETLNDFDAEISPEAFSRLRNKMKSQEKQIINLQKKNSILEKDIRQYQNEISQLENKIDKMQYQYSQNILHQRQIATKTAIIRGIQEKYHHEKKLKEDLEEQLKSIKRIRVMELSRETTPVKIIDSFSKDGIREAVNSRNIKKGDVVFLRSSQGGGSQTAALLVDSGVKAVITVDKMSHHAKDEFERNMVPLLDEEDVDLKMADDFAVIITNDLDHEINKWAKNQQEKKKKEDRNKLLKIMDDYKAQRKRSSNNF